VAATRREYAGAVPVHVDLSLHRVSLTRMAQPGMAQADRTEIIDNVGQFALYDRWITTVSEAFVQQSRFDPLHTADTEQMLLDRMGDWLREASSRDHVLMEIEAGGTTYWETSADGVNWTEQTQLTNPIDPTSVFLHAGAGTYEVVVFKEGYRTWRTEDVVVTNDECHVQTVRFDVFLERE